MEMEGKKVILICPAPHVQETQITEDFDIVCRVGGQIPLSDKMKWATGDRTDYWYCANVLLIEQPELCQYTRFVRTTERMRPHVPPDQFQLMDARFRALRRYTGHSCLNRGFRALIDIINQKPSDIYVTGMTFYHSDTPYIDGYNGNPPEQVGDGNVGGHDQDRQMRFFKKVLSPYVRIDPVMQKILWQK